jgi:hypothetical protein
MDEAKTVYKEHRIILTVELTVDPTLIIKTSLHPIPHQLKKKQKGKKQFITCHRIYPIQEHLQTTLYVYVRHG